MIPVCVRVLVQPFPRLVPARPQGPSVAQLVETAGSVRQEGVRLLSSDVCPAGGPGELEVRLGRGQHQEEVDRQTGVYPSLPPSATFSVHNQA